MSDHPMLPFDAPEHWRPAVGWECLYLVSDLGRVRALPRKTATGIHGGRRPYLSAYLENNGYYRVKLSRDGRMKRVLVHHLVTDAFLGPLPPGLVRRHRNGNKLDNRAVNFEFGTHSDNVQDSLRHGSLHPAHGSAHCQAKLTEALVREIRSRYAGGGCTYKVLAMEYGVSQGSILDAIRRKTWKHVA